MSALACSRQLTITPSQAGEHKSTFLVLIQSLQEGIAYGDSWNGAGVIEGIFANQSFALVIDGDQSGDHLHGSSILALPWRKGISVSVAKQSSVAGSTSQLA